MSTIVNMVKQNISNVIDMKYSIDVKNAYDENGTKLQEQVVNFPRFPNHIF